MKETDTAYFVSTLTNSKNVTDKVIQDYWVHELHDISTEYGEASFRTISAFASIMDRGGKRIRAALSEATYKMFGGTDQRVIDGLGLALEMIHAYLLVIDDICDHSDVRRGGPSVHRIIEQWHQDNKLHGDTEHFGTSMATLSATTGMHRALLIIGSLPVSTEQRLAALDNVNRLLIKTSHGQINDMFNEASITRNRDNIENVLVWKTAYYTFANPLQFGAILAGAPKQALGVLMEYSLAAGRAFQLSDDIIGTFGIQEKTGKSSSDDIKEGKRTLLTVKALEMAPAKDAEFLESQLGNINLTAKDFARCQDIIRSSGALQYVQNELNTSCQQAIDCINNTHLPEGDGLRFLRGLAGYLQERKS